MVKAPLGPAQHHERPPTSPVLAEQEEEDDLGKGNMSTKKRLTPVVFQLISGFEGGFYLLADWERIRAILEAIESSRTWEDFQKALPEGEWEKLELTVNPGYAFDPERLPGYSEGDYPDWLGYMLDSQLSDGFIDRFGRRAASMVSGCWIEFPQERLEEMKEVLFGNGFEVVQEAEVLKPEEVRGWLRLGTLTDGRSDEGPVQPSL